MIAKRHFDRAGTAAVQLLKELKPYKGGNVALRAIHDLNVRDKHRTLIVHAVSSISPRMQMTPAGLMPVGEPTKPSEVKLVFPLDCALAETDLIPTLHELVDLASSVVEAFKPLAVPTGQTPV